MTRRTKPVTFVGPVANFGARYGKLEYGFLMLQNTGQQLKLEYGSKDEAKAARDVLTQAANTHSVLSHILLYAIEIALQQAFKAGESHLILEPGAETEQLS